MAAKRPPISMHGREHEFIHREQMPYPIRIQCRVLEVHPSGSYAWCRMQQTGTLGKRATENAKLLQEVQQIHYRQIIDQ